MGTYFDIFELKPGVDLDANALEQKYRALSLQLHPDRLGNLPHKERLAALETAASLNDAFRTLKDPVKRAFYLLKLRGIDLDREDAGAQKSMPMEFLEEVIELRERLDALEERKDLAGAQTMADRVRAREKTALDEAFALLRDGSPESTTKASHALGRVRYFTRFLEEVERMEEEDLGA
jgi:molecular chaperone HscB